LKKEPNAQRSVNCYDMTRSQTDPEALKVFNLAPVR